MRCLAQVADYGGWHWHTCGKPAKYELRKIGNLGETIYACGIHRRKFLRRGWTDLRAIEKSP